MVVKHTYRAALILPNFLILGPVALPDSHKLQLYKLTPYNVLCGRGGGLGGYLFLFLNAFIMNRVQTVHNTQYTVHNRDIFNDIP